MQGIGKDRQIEAMVLEGQGLGDPFNIAFSVSRVLFPGHADLGLGALQAHRSRTICPQHPHQPTLSTADVENIETGDRDQAVESLEIGQFGVRCHAFTFLGARRIGTWAGARPYRQSAEKQERID